MANPNPEVRALTNWFLNLKEFELLEMDQLWQQQERKWIAEKLAHDGREMHLDWKARDLEVVK